MDALPGKKKNLPKRGKEKQETRTESLLRRQKDKSWLETHIWHSKRMRMENMWGYRLAVKPTEKAYRPSHRASVQGSIIHDASYYSLVELRGSSETITGSLSLCCDPQGPNPSAASRLTSGSRTHETHIYEPGKYPFGLICPISVIWKPISESLKGKETESNSPTAASASSVERTVWIRFHPVVHSQVLSALQTAGSQYLAKKKAEGNEGIQLEICDLKDQINVFEIMGPQASQVIRGALSAVPGDSRPEFRQFWSSLAEVQTSGSVPRNMVIGFKVLDPRLRFPPKLAKPKPTNQRRNDVFPSVALAKSDIWDESVRLGIAKPKYTKKELDDRRAKNLIPGTPLNPQRQDDRVPVILIQRSLEAARKNGGHPIHGWTLIIPSGWGMAFWNSLVFTGTRVAGQRERQTQAYEAGTAYFPRDYPSTSAYHEYSTAKEEELRDTWERKPPAKRVNYEKLNVQDPFAPNWNWVLWASRHPGDGGDLVPTQREPTAPTPIGAPWLLRGANSAKIVQQLTLPIGPSDFLLREMNSLRVARALGPLPDALNNRDLMQAALVTVKVNVCRRGLPEDLALIYSMDDEEVSKAIAVRQVKTDEAEVRVLSSHFFPLSADPLHQ
ncbi:hypothetical protein EST38_g1333 [Candolleomyces aberdarensis]|uniref:Uncharacterized protein n=1 Tax=Candolleomyces aberdarensis TaxID=2316362 RepID=A0A4Q2DYA2_9AGAR|nr:hypothetical protein EST38_g1333 [Candolleomyces aberdarensis]